VTHAPAAKIANHHIALHEAAKFAAPIDDDDRRVERPAIQSASERQTNTLGASAREGRENEDNAFTRREARTNGNCVFRRRLP
jgi:hypothetical protein